jgi:hypothetical protein
MRRDADELEGFLEFLAAEIAHPGCARPSRRVLDGDRAPAARVAGDARRPPLLRRRAARAHGRRRDDLPRDGAAASALRADLLLAAALCTTSAARASSAGPDVPPTDEGGCSATCTSGCG